MIKKLAASQIFDKLRHPMKLHAQLLGEEFGPEYSGSASSSIVLKHGEHDLSIELRSVSSDTQHLHDLEAIAAQRMQRASSIVVSFPHSMRPPFFERIMRCVQGKELAALEGLLP